MLAKVAKIVPYYCNIEFSSTQFVVGKDSITSTFDFPTLITTPNVLHVYLETTSFLPQV